MYILPAEQPDVFQVQPPAAIGIVAADVWDILVIIAADLIVITAEVVSVLL
jgi:hypothetical protein